MSPRQKLAASVKVDRVRQRLAEIMARPITTKSPCPKCKGHGVIARTAQMPALEVERQTGISSSQIGSFLKGKGNLSLENGLTLIAWIDEQEKPIKGKAFEGVPDDAPRSPAVREGMSERLRQIHNASADAAAKAGIDAINRPIGSPR